MKYFILCLLFAAPCLLFAQTAERIERLLEQERVSYRDAALLVLEASGKIDPAIQTSADNAFNLAMQQGWVPNGAQANINITLSGLSLLVIQAFEINGGVLFSLFKNPHYAYRAMVYRGIIHGRTDPQMQVSGELLLYTVNRAIKKEE